MVIAVLMWLLLILLAMMALAGLIGAVLFLLGICFQGRKDWKTAMVYMLMFLLCTGMSTGFVFAAIAVGRNLL